MPNTATGPDDIVYSATVEDNTGTFFDNFDKRIKAVGETAGSGLETISKGFNMAGMAAGAVGGAVAGLALGAFQKITGMVGDINSFLSQSKDLAARSDTLGVVLDVVGKNAGYSKEQIAEFQTGLQGLGISILESKESLAKMAQSELDLTQATKLARVAQDAAVIGNINSSEAFQRLIWGVTTMQPRMLRTMGLIVNMQTEIRKYAAAHKIAANAVSEEEKRQIAMNAVLEAGKKINGAYEASLTTIGKKMGSLVRYRQDFMVLLGAVFQKSAGAWIDYLIESLKSMQQWIKDNSDALEHFGDILGNFTTLAINTFKTLTSYVVGWGKTTLTAFKDVSLQIAKGISVADQYMGAGPALSDEEIQQRGQHLGEYFAQAIVILVAYVGEALKVTKEAIGGLWDYIKLTPQIVKEALSYKVSASNWGKPIQLSKELQDQIDKASKRFENLGEVGTWAFNDAGKAAANLFGMNEKVADGAKEAADALAQEAANAEELAAATDGLNQGLDKLYRKMLEDIKNKAIAESRQAIETQLRNSWAAEDLARKHQEAVAQIMENAQKSEREAADQHSQALIDIEKNYQRQLRDMQMKFEFDADEFARSRDAVGLLRLIRQHNFELKQAKTNRDDQVKDTNDSWEQQKKQLDEQRQEQLKALQEQEQKEAEERERAAERERQLQQLRDQWAREDRDRAYAQQISDLIDQFQILKNTQDSGLQGLMQQWEMYFGNLITVAQQRQAELNAILTPGSIPYTGNGPGGTGVPGVTGGIPQITGQAGQVSALLAAPGSLFTPTGSIPRLPSSTGAASRGKGSVQTLNVNVSGEAFDPYIQRVLAMALVEVERNR